VDLVQLESDLRDYLDTWEQENASRFRGGDGFPAKPVEMVRDDLVLVAFVQDDNSKTVLQAKLVPLK
jgi:hypothetical protein